MVEILSIANMYEEPRPPRRGSHRPAVAGGVLGPHQALSRSMALPLTKHLVSRPMDPLRRQPFYSGHPSTPEYFPSSLFEHREGPHHGGGAMNMSALQQPQSASRDKTAFTPPIPRPGSPVDMRSDTSCSSEQSDSMDTHTRNRLLVRPSLELIRQMSGDSAKICLEQSILESFARAAPQSASCQSVQKRCMYPNCVKISVSRGLCRGHGGGRRCQVSGCTKSAQSRSNFCWAHGGGKRCEADNCMRSRKSKRFCVKHLHLEDITVVPVDDGAVTTKRAVTASRRDCDGSSRGGRSGSTVMMLDAQPSSRCLPSLGQALSTASRSAPNLPWRRQRGYDIQL